MESQLDPPLLAQEYLYMLQQRNVDWVILFGFTGMMAPMCLICSMKNGGG